MPPLLPAADVLIVLIRWLHAMAAIGWLGWSFVYLFDQPTSGEIALRSRRFKEITEITLVVFLATGAILSVDRLSQGAGPVYAAVLALKILAAVGAYQFAFRWRRVGLPYLGTDGRVLAILGTVAVLLAVILKGIFEHGLRGV